MNIYQNNEINDFKNAIDDSDIICVDIEHLSNTDKINDYVPKDLNESYIESTIADSNYVSETSVTLTEGSLEKDEDSLEYQLDDANINSMSIDNNISNDYREIDYDLKYLCDNKSNTLQNGDDYGKDNIYITVDKIDHGLEHSTDHDVYKNLNNIALIKETTSHNVTQSDSFYPDDLSDKEENIDHEVDETFNDDLDDGKFFDCEDSGFNDNDMKSNQNSWENLDSNLSETNVNKLNKSAENLSDTIMQEGHNNEIYNSCAEDIRNIDNTANMNSDGQLLNDENVCANPQMDSVTHSYDNNLANDIYSPSNAGEIDYQSSDFDVMDLNQHEFDSSDWLYSVNTDHTGDKFDMDSAFSFNRMKLCNGVINNSLALSYELSRPFECINDTRQYIYPNTLHDASPIKFSNPSMISSTPFSNKMKNQVESTSINNTFTKFQSTNEEPLKTIGNTFEVLENDPIPLIPFIRHEESLELVWGHDHYQTIINSSSSNVPQEHPEDNHKLMENKKQAEDINKTTIIGPRPFIPKVRTGESPRPIENELSIEDLSTTMISHRRPSIPLMSGKLTPKSTKISSRTDDYTEKQIAGTQKVTSLPVDHEEPRKLTRIANSTPSISHLKKPIETLPVCSNQEKPKKPTGLIPPSTSRVSLHKDSNRPATPKSGDEFLPKQPPTERSNAQINQLKSKSLIKRPTDLIKPKSGLRIPTANSGPHPTKSNPNALSRETTIPNRNGVLIRSNIKLDSTRRHTVIEISPKEPTIIPTTNTRPHSMIKFNEFKQPTGISKMTKPLRASVASVSSFKKPDESVSKIQKSPLVNLKESGIPKTKFGLKPPSNIQTNLKKPIQNETLPKPFVTQPSSILPIQSENPPIISPISNYDSNPLNRTFDREDFQILKSFTNSNNNDGDNSSEASNETLHLSSDSENNNSTLSNRSLFSQANAKKGIYQLALKEEENLKKHVNTALIGQSKSYRSLKLPSQPKPRGIPTFKK